MLHGKEQLPSNDLLDCNYNPTQCVHILWVNSKNLTSNLSYIIFSSSQSLDFDDNTTWIIVSTIFGLELFTLTCFVALVVSDPGILVKPLSEIRSEDCNSLILD